MNYLSTNDVAIGRRMRQIRQAASMTQEKLADILGISVNYLGEVERGRKPLSRGLADQFCLYFHVTYDYLYYGTMPISRYAVCEKSNYESVRASLIEQLKYCSHDEIVMISQLVGSYLSTSRHLQKQELPQNHQNREEHSDPQE